MSRLQNKAQVEFNWILVMIAGIIILAVFIAFALDYKSLSERKLNTQLSLSLSSQLDSYTSSGLTTEINPNGISFFNTKFDCDSVAIETGYPIQVKDKVIFSPSSIDTDKLLLYVGKFSAPYRISNIYYISSPYVKYYILYDDSTYSLASSILELFPKSKDDYFFNVAMITSLDEIKKDIQTEKLRQIRVISLKEVEQVNLGIKSRISKLDGTLNSGSLLDLEDNSILEYNKRELLLAAIISEDYSCNVDKLLAKINKINSVYADKTQRLFLKTQAKQPECNYQLFKQSINLITLEDMKNILIHEQKLTSQNIALNSKGCKDVF